MRPIIQFFAFILCLLLPDIALGHGVKVTSAAELAQKSEQLKPGEWIWAPQVAPAGPIEVYIDLSRQLASVYRNGVQIGVSTVSSGMPGYETPTGIFRILQKDAYHRSNIYDNAPMPYQQRLTWSGVALHGGRVPGYPESHGCVRLPLEFSRLLFGVTALGGTVIVAGRASDPLRSAGILPPPDDQSVDADHTPLTPVAKYLSAPETSPGPVTIIRVTKR